MAKDTKFNAQEALKESIMPLNGMILKKAGANSVTGGTDVTYTEDGQEVPNGTHLVDSSVTDFRTRSNIKLQNRIPTYNSLTGEYSKDKKTVTLVCPKILESGKTVYNLIRIEREVHPESTAAEAAELNIQGAQLLFDSDAANFWAVGSLA
jgi:hypothetical protein